jgi:hypothetical protein
LGSFQEAHVERQRDVGWSIRLDDVENSPEELELGVFEILQITERPERFDEMKLEQKLSLESLASHGRVGHTPFPLHFMNSHSEVFAD